jgi:hypothetical protein
VICYDSASPQYIPGNANPVAGYIDGEYKWSAEDWKRFPDADKMTITVEGSTLANWCDVENGALTPAQALRWLETKAQENLPPIGFYTSLGNLSYLQAVLRGHDYWLWVADWTGEPHTIKGAELVQYQNVGNLYDRSWVYDMDLVRECAAYNARHPEVFQ